MVAPVSVNPSSSLYVAPTTTGQAANGAQSFYFGGNPTAAALLGNASNVLTNPWALGALALVAIAFMRKGKL